MAPFFIDFPLLLLLSQPIASCQQACQIMIWATQQAISDAGAFKVAGSDPASKVGATDRLRLRGTGFGAAEAAAKTPMSKDTERFRSVDTFGFFAMPCSVPGPNAQPEGDTETVSRVTKNRRASLTNLVLSHRPSSRSSLRRYPIPVHHHAIRPHPS